MLRERRGRVGRDRARALGAPPFLGGDLGILRRQAGIGIRLADVAGIELGREYLKLVAREMPTIPLMSYNVLTVMDDTYWSGYPSAETAPYTDPVPNWGNTRYMMTKLKPRS